MTLFSKTVAERTKPGQRQDIEEQSHTFHVYGRTEGVAGVIISDHEYPALVAHQVLSKVMDEFLSKYPRTAYASPSTTTLAFPQLKEYLVKYQDPQQADSIMKIQKELDETKIVLHKTIESVLERGEKIDSLVAKSDGLSAQSKMFYTQVRQSTPSFSIRLLTGSSFRQRNRTPVALLCEHGVWTMEPLVYIRFSGNPVRVCGIVRSRHS
jgi:synaptobrevin family protein YKT6